MNTLENTRLADYRTFCDLVNTISAKKFCSESTINNAQQKKAGLQCPIYQVVINNQNGLVNIIKESPNVKVYPSQITDYATIDLKSIPLFPVKTEVREISGKVINKAFYAHEDEMVIDLSRLRPGFYEIEIMDALKSLGEIKLIKYHQAEVTVS